MALLNGKVALITGASRGIGAAAAKCFAREGASVALNYHPNETMEGLAVSVADEIEAFGGSAITVGADMQSPLEIERMVSDVRDSLGDIDVLVTNAAGAQRGPWADISTDEWDGMFATDVRGAFLCCKAVASDMEARRSGSIITVSSIAVEVGQAGSLAYVSSKAAVVGMTRSLAREIGRHNVRINSVMPGAIRTERQVETGVRFEDASRLARERQSLAKVGTPDDVSDVMLFLASDLSRFMTGQVLVVDGGWVYR